MTTLTTNTENVTRTENGMLTNPTTLNSCVDLFFSIGSMRGKSESTLHRLFSESYNENPLITMKILFWSRDVRGGAGERKVFRDILSWLVLNHPQSVSENIHLIPEYGRWDDVLTLVGTPLETEMFCLIKTALSNMDGLCAKWMPRKGGVANKLRKMFRLNPKQYRKMLVNLTNVVETKMCSKDWESIDYSKLPSLASSRYQNSFQRNDTKRYEEYKEKLLNGEAKVNASTLYPYDVIKSMNNGGDLVVCEKQWESLPNYMDNSDERILPVVDVSGSMSCSVGDNPNLSCMDVAISLGMYISERNVGIFENMFITFSERPRIEYLKGNTLKERYTNLGSSDWGYNTDFIKVFQLILEQAVNNNVSEDQMPTKIIVLSDMEFDVADGSYDDTAYGYIRRIYEEKGYRLPDIIFWNLNARGGNFPVDYTTNGTALVSGFSPSILKSVLKCEDFSPLNVMLDTIGSERYEKIKIV